jgi:hypothetical protein
MYNWSTDISKFAGDNKALAIWKLEQMVNFGLGRNGKIEEQELYKYFDKLTIDPDRRKLFSLLLYGK